MGGPLRVLHVVVNMNRGGAETLIMNLYRNMDRTKIQFNFLTCKEGVFDEEIRELGGEIHRIPYISEVGHLKFAKELNRFFKENNHYKIVHSHLDKMSGLILNAANKAGIPVRISHSHNTRSEGGLAARIYKWYVGNLILSNSTNLVACSSEAAKWLFRKKHDSALILKNGIDPIRFNFVPNIRDKVRDQLNLNQDEFVLGHIGRFNHQKNHTFLIDLFAQLQKEVLNSTLILVGDGELRPSIEKKIKYLKLEKKVLLLGERSDINHLLQAFDLFLFPSLHEGLPVSLVEAQGAGLPCLISDNISKEADLNLGLVNYAPVTSMNIWMNKIKVIQTVKRKRAELSQKITKEGFDIRKTANDIENYYCTISR